MRSKAFTSITLTALMTFAGAVQAFAGQWQQDTSQPANASGVSNWWYQEDDGTYPVSCWKEIAGKQYYFNEAGWMLAGTETPDHYWVDESGAWIEENAFSKDTMIQWFNNCYGPLTESNGASLGLYGGFRSGNYTKESIQSALATSWGVTDKQTAQETMRWLMEEGHRTAWQETMQLLEAFGAMEISADELKKAYGDDDGTLLADMQEAWRRRGMEGISGWDYGRAMQLSAWYYLSGYYSYEESLDQSLEIARVIQSQYTSWDDYMESYLRGYEYWRSDPQAYVQRKTFYDRIRTSVYYEIDWNTPLGKAW